MPVRSTTGNCFWIGILVCFTAPILAADATAPESSVPDYHCVVMPSAVVDVASGSSGRVERIHVERGDPVRAGQEVAALESGVEMANMVLAKTRAELDTGIHLRRARLAFEERKVDRTDRLHNRKVVSEHQQDEAETDARLAAWQLRQAVDDQALARLELVRAEEVLKRRLVHSPIDGVVVERFKWPGEYVEEEPVLRVARLNPLWIEVVAPVSLHGEIHKNMLAEVMAETEEDRVREARVTVIDAMGDAASGTFRVRLELPNPDLDLLGGVKCKARFPMPARYAPEPVEAATQEEVSVPVEPLVIPQAPSPERAFSTDSPVEPVQAHSERVGANGYIVLTPLVARSERRQVTTSLREAGVRDFLLMTGGPYAGRISLGTYKGPRMAERRKSQLSRLGFEADVVPRIQDSSHRQDYVASPVIKSQGDGEMRQPSEDALTQKLAGRDDERG